MAISWFTGADRGQNPHTEPRGAPNGDGETQNTKELKRPRRQVAASTYGRRPGNKRATHKGAVRRVQQTTKPTMHHHKGGRRDAPGKANIVLNDEPNPPPNKPRKQNYKTHTSASDAFSERRSGTRPSWRRCPCKWPAKVLPPRGRCIRAARACIKQTVKKRANGKKRSPLPKGARKGSAQRALNERKP